MALKLTQTYKGITADYWRILAYIANVNKDETLVTVGLYASSDARAAGAGFVLEKQAVVVEGVDLTRSDMYASLKALPEFNTAQDT